LTTGVTGLQAGIGPTWGTSRSSALSHERLPRFDAKARGKIMKKRTIRLSILLFLGLATLLALGESGLWLSSAEAQSVVLGTGWEDGQNYGFSDKVQYSKDVVGYFNSSSPPPECSRRYRETVRSGNYSLLLSPRNSYRGHA
jgi:hypothetical protein